MLIHLHIRDLVIVRALDLEFNPGMTALTGETGAGKSILVDALGLVLGSKADKDMIRAGCEQAEVSVSFDLLADSPALKWLESNELDAAGECVLRRVLSNTGRARAWINGRPVTQQQLNELGDLLIDIHGQHEHQGLLRGATQRQLLDAYAGHKGLVDDTSAAYDQHAALRAECDDLKKTAIEREQRLDYLDFQIGEIERLAPAANEYQQMLAEHARLANASLLGTETQALTLALLEADDALAPTLSRLAHRLAELQKLDTHLGECGALLDSARINIEEAASLLRDYQDSVQDDPERLAAMDARLAEFHAIARKHRVKPADLPDLLQHLQQERDQLGHSLQNLGLIEQKAGQALSAYLNLARQLSESRIEAATRLAHEITESMQGLALAGGRFDVSVQPTDKPARHGQDRIEFQVSANPGQPLSSLAKVASGGELSRISLAIQVATSAWGEVPTLIFDEVDVGIGGAVAEIVGKLLRELGGKRQVLCVTHLPQVAAQAHQQLQVSKHSDGQSTQTNLKNLSAEERVKEIARMLGGREITSQTLAHASEMLQMASASHAT